MSESKRRTEFLFIEHLLGGDSKMLGCFYAKYEQQSTRSLSAEYTDYADLFLRWLVQVILKKCVIGGYYLWLTAKTVRDYCSNAADPNRSSVNSALLFRYLPWL
jgi:hypothetical protein